MTEITAFLVLITTVTIHAGWRGGAPERCAAAAMALATIATSLTNLKAPLPFRTVQWQLVWIDTALFVVLLVIALTANRFWPLWIAAIQCLALGAHASRAFAPDILPLAYWLIIGKLSYPMLLLLVIGTERHHRRSRRSRRSADDPPGTAPGAGDGVSSPDPTAPAPSGADRQMGPDHEAKRPERR
ncbi:hypothetical protein ABIC78_002594 [Novosphingobium sp. 1529]|uniref:hypothetical protein n=1 Tax=Novosphingobium sp. 1529 TaxID=3156424 RepID=UPI003397FC4F